MSLSLVWVLLGMLASASGHVTTGFVGTGVPDTLTILDRYVRIQVLFVVSEKHLLAWFNYKATFMFVHQLFIYNYIINRICFAMQSNTKLRFISI